MTTATLEGTVEEYLRSKNVDVYRAGSGQLTLKCLWHDDSRPKGKLYVNAENGAFDCKGCGTQGGLRMLMEHFGDELGESSSAYKPSRKLLVNTEYAVVAASYLAANSKVSDYLLERGLSPEVIKEAGLGYHGRGTSIVDALPSYRVPGGLTKEEIVSTGLMYESGKEALTGRITIPYWSHGQAVQVRGKEMTGKYMTPAGQDVRLYNEDALRGAEVVLITEGEFDCLILQDVLRLSPDVKARNIAVVAVPGTQSLPRGKEKFATFFDHCKRVYIGFDTDNAGRRGALAVKELLGTKARILELPEEELDWTDYLAPQTEARPHGGHGWKDVVEIIRVADMRDKRLFTVQDAAAQMREIENSAPAIKLGFPALDALIAPGLRPGSLTVPLARTGNGKSIFLQNVMYYTRHIPTLAVTLELTAAETWVRLRRIARFHNPGMTDEQIEGLYPLLRICDQNQLRQSDLNQLVEEYKDDVGEPPAIGHVDYLGYYARAQPGDSPYMKVSNAVMSLKEWAKEHSLAALSPGQVNRGAKPGEPISEDSARDAGPVEETADFLFGIWRPWEADEVQKSASSGAVQDTLKLRILKSRHGNKGKTVDLSMGHHSLAIVDGFSTRGVNQINLENQAYNRGERYEDYFARQREGAYRDLQGKLAGTDGASATKTLASTAADIPPWET